MIDLDDEQLLRYSRQIMLPQWDVAAQEKILASRVLIIGMGGLGSVCAMYLGAAGVGHLILVDFDRVDLSNLQRQIAHGMQDIGRTKVASARDTLQALNPGVQVTPLATRLSPEELLAQVRQVDAVVDACDNFATRFLVNQCCVEAGKPLISGAAIRFEGQLGVFAGHRPESPCYRCLYGDDTELPGTCAENGIIAPLVGVIGSLQALEALKVIAGIGTTLEGQLLVVDALHTEWRRLRLKKDPECPVCRHFSLISK